MTCYFSESCKKRESCNEEKVEFCVRQFKIDTLMNNALLSDAQKKDICLFLDNVERKESFDILLKIKNSITNFVTTGNNLLIFGNTTGSGKTSWALKLLRQYILKNWVHSNCDSIAMFISVPKFLVELKKNISEPSEYIDYIMNNIYSCDLIVWDDIATKNASTFETEQLLSYINSRCDNKKSNIFTSNALPNQLEELLGARLASRVLSGIKVQFFGLDKRVALGGKK